MRPIDQVEVTLKGLGAKPFITFIPKEFGYELRNLLSPTKIKRAQKQKESESISVDKAFPGLFSSAKGVGVCLKGLRYREKLTQEQLAKKLDIHQHHVSEMESGKRAITKQMAQKLAKILRTDWRIFMY